MQLKTITLLTILLSKINLAAASHLSHQQEGGSSLPIHEELSANILYILIPFIAFSMLFNELQQLYLERKYADNSLKDAKDLENYTITSSIVLTGLLLFTRVFHMLPALSEALYVGIILSLFTSALLLRYKDSFQELQNNE